MADAGGDEVPPVPIDDYTPEALAACEKALRTIVARIGDWGPQLVLFGGLAPRYLVEAPPPEIGAHTGTTDLDVVVGVEIDAPDAAVYTKLQQELKEAGFEPSDEGSYAWERRVDGIRVVLEFFCPVEGGQKSGTLKRNPGGKTGSTISAIRLRGAELAAADCTTRILSGDILDHGGRRDVEVRVANILPFLVLKAFALVSREKDKDAYDIVWTLNAFGDEGPASAAETAAESPVADREEAREAIDVLREQFGSPEAKGPSNHARFLLGGRDGVDDRRARYRRDAMGAVRAFLSRWDAIRGGTGARSGFR